MNEKGNRNRVKQYGPALVFAAFILLYVVLNLFWTYMRADDFNYREVLHEFDSLWEWFVYNYNSWSGRLVQVIHVVFLQAGVWPFQLVNSCVMAVQMYLLYRMARDAAGRVMETAEKMVLTLFCGVGLIFVGWIYESMFWPAAMITFTWGTFCSLAVVCTLRDAAKGSAIAGWRWALTCLAACYASYSEQSAAVQLGFLVVFAGAFLALRRPIPRPYWLVAALAVVNTAISWLAPGNAVRYQTETLLRWPDYETYGLFRKLALGVSYALDGLTGTWLRYTLVAAALLVLSNLLRRRWLAAVLSLIPAGYYEWAVLGEWFPPLRAAVPIYSYLPGDDLFAGTPWLAFCTFLGLFVFLLLAFLLFLSGPQELDWFSGFLALAAFGSLVMMGFSPTIYVSGSRCGYMYNVLINLVSVRLWCRSLTAFRWPRWAITLAGVGILGFTVLVTVQIMNPVL